MSGHAVSIVMLTWNHQAVSVEAIGHVLMNASVPTQLIVVDNASTDGTREFLRRLPPRVGMVEVAVVENPVNVGFPAGVNQGLALADGAHVVLLNNDVLVPRQWDSDLLEQFDAHPRMGLIGPVTNRVTGPQARSATYAPAAFLSHAAAWRQQPGHSVQPATRLVGFCLMVRRAVLDRIGGLDARFSPGMFEDDDFGVRAMMAGFEMGIATRVFVHHFGSVSFGEDRDRMRHLLAGNERLFRRKWRAGVSDPGRLFLPFLPAVRSSHGAPVSGLAPLFVDPEERAIRWAHAVGRHGVEPAWLVPVDPDLESPDAVGAAFREAATTLGLTFGRDVEVVVDRYPYSAYLSRLAAPGCRLVLGDAPMDAWFEAMLTPHGTSVVGRRDAGRERLFQTVWRDIQASHA